MRIYRPDRSEDETRLLKQEIAAVAQSAGIGGRVCGARCTVKCSHCGSTACQCMCSVDCSEAPRALSVDPVRYPIEPAIAPLVFEMKRLGMFQPCWSCGGHTHPDGSLWKMPGLWFYCTSFVTLRLLADGLSNMNAAGRLHTPWRIAVTYSDPDNPETAFALEPLLSPDETPSLAALQDDVAQIARSLHAMVTDQARKLQRGTTRPLSAHF